MKRLLPALVLSAALIAVGGCGDDGGNAPGEQPNGTQTTEGNGGGY